MKKIIRGFFIFISLVLASIVAFPWNDTAQWGLDFPILQEQEIYIKAGIGLILLIISVVYLVLTNLQKKKLGTASMQNVRVAFIPLYMYTVAVAVYSALVLYTVYAATPNALNLMKSGFFGLIALVLIIYSHLFIRIFKKQSNFGRWSLFILMLINAGVLSYLAFWFRSWGITDQLYSIIQSNLYIAITGGVILGFISHTMILSIRTKVNKKPKEKNDKPKELEFENIKTGKKKSIDVPKNSTIVPENQAIVTSENDLDPTNIVYEDVNIDPEFSASKNSQQPNSIEYYIEKPKMFKPLDPSFDQLVAYIRGLPQVVTKLDDDKITFYIDRQPFIVLMNFGNYYRMAFKYDLEKGIRLIIKYPTISKNKSTRDELWFKANNYGDIPKDVIFSIVKSSYDTINL